MSLHQSMVLLCAIYELIKDRTTEQKGIIEILLKSNGGLHILDTESRSVAKRLAKTSMRIKNTQKKIYQAEKDANIIFAK